MLISVKALRGKNPGIQFVHDKQGHNVKQPQEMYTVIENHFKNHFQKIILKK